MNAQQPEGPAVILIGPPGSGKTTVGRLLAMRWGVPFEDTDHVVEEAAGKSVADIFIDEGEDRFRDLERAAVAAGLTHAGVVLALGGGAVLDPVTQESLAGRPVVFLDVTIADAAPRVGFNQARPLLVGNPRGRWVELMAQRRPTYERLARWTVMTDGVGPAEVAGRIADLVVAPGARQQGVAR